MTNSGKIKLVVDTNIWISYFISEQQSPLHFFLLNNRFEIFTSKELRAILKSFERTRIINLSDFLKVIL